MAQSKCSEIVTNPYTGEEIEITAWRIFSRVDSINELHTFFGFFPMLTHDKVRV